ncbi:M-phase inducer phosphatase-like isoform X1 [Argonauta hians]
MPNCGKSLRIMPKLDLNPSTSTDENTGRLNSPVTNLASNLRELRTDGSSPKRRLSLNNVNCSVLSDCFLDSPTPFYSPSEEYRNKPLKHSFFNPPFSETSQLDSYSANQAAYSLDTSLETEQDDSNSRDSGLGSEKEKDIEFLQRDNSPKKPVILSSCEKDDGFSDHFESLDTSMEAMPDSFKSLIDGPLSSCTVEGNERTSSCKIEDSYSNTPTTLRVARPLANKRDRIRDENTPVHQKRRRPAHGKASPSLKRCFSETEAQIKAAVYRISHDPSLIGDASKTYCLPTTTGKHGDLKSITSETVKALLGGHYDKEVNSYSIIDCRYPYEYEGGHIVTAKNIYDKDSIFQIFLKNPPNTNNSGKRDIIVFHCEFSSERAPKLARYLRNKDRSANENNYPALYYPEIYILDGGYKDFHEKCLDCCEPQTYKPMLHRDHSSDLKRFRLKSKSWAGEKPHRNGLRQLNF